MQNLELELKSLDEERIEILLTEIEDMRVGNVSSLQHELERERDDASQSAQKPRSPSISGTYQNLVERAREARSRPARSRSTTCAASLQVRALDQILFDSGKHRDQAAGCRRCSRASSAMPDPQKLKGHRVRVEGHTDSVPIATARFPSNWELSAARAAVVVRFLIEQGLEPTKLSADGATGPVRCPIADERHATGARAQPPHRDRAGAGRGRLMSRRELLLESLFRTGVRRRRTDARAPPRGACASADRRATCTLYRARRGQGGLRHGARAPSRVLGDRIVRGLDSPSPRTGTARPVAGIEVIEAVAPASRRAQRTPPRTRALEIGRRARSTRSEHLLVPDLGRRLGPAGPAPVDPVCRSTREASALTDAAACARVPASTDLNAVRRAPVAHQGGRPGSRRALAPPSARSQLSDVARGPPRNVIGSGPTAPDPTTYADALRVLDRFAVTAPADARAHLAAGARGERPETPKPGDAQGFERVEHHIVGSLAVALDAVEAAAIERGLRVVRLPDDLYGEARDCGRRLAERARAERGSGPVLLLAGGEPTVDRARPGPRRARAGGSRWHLRTRHRGRARR